MTLFTIAPWFVQLLILLLGSYFQLLCCPLIWWQKSKKNKEHCSENFWFCNRQRPHLEDIEQGRHVVPVEAEGDSKYSWCQEEYKQKGQPHGDGYAEVSAEWVSSAQCEPSHAVEEEISAGQRLGFFLSFFF